MVALIVVTRRRSGSDSESRGIPSENLQQREDLTVSVADTAGASDSDLLTDIEQRTFEFFWERVNHRNGLMPDRWPAPSPCSIAATGFALTAWPIGVERGWITRDQACDITLRALRFMDQLPQGEQPIRAITADGFGEALKQRNDPMDFKNFGCAPRGKNLIRTII